MRPSYPRPMMSSRRKDERVHKNAIFNRLTAGVSSAFNSCTGPWSLDLDDLVARHVFSSVCARQNRLPAAPWPEGDEFTELVLNG